MKNKKFTKKRRINKTNRKTKQRKTLKKKRKTKQRKNNKYFKKRQKGGSGRSGGSGKMGRQRTKSRHAPISEFTRGDTVYYYGSEGETEATFLGIITSGLHEGLAKIQRVRDDEERHIKPSKLNLVSKKDHSGAGGGGAMRSVQSPIVGTFDLSSDIKISGHSLEVLYDTYIVSGITHEVCGPFSYQDPRDGTIILEVDGGGAASGGRIEDRESCDNRNEKEYDRATGLWIYKPYIFHTHPYGGKYYPSPEDIIKTVRGSGTRENRGHYNGLTHILFTEHGLWIMRSENCPQALDYPTSIERDGVGWVHDSSSESCYVCEKPFGVWHGSKHHCRKCGNLVCDTCSKKRVTMEATEGKGRFRICDNCFRTLPSQVLFQGLKSVTDQFCLDLPEGRGRVYIVGDTNRRDGEIETLCNQIMKIPILREAGFKIQWVERDLRGDDGRRSEEWENLRWAP
jgi:hypothetical protein